MKKEILYGPCVAQISKIGKDYITAIVFESDQFTHVKIFRGRLPKGFPIVIGKKIKVFNIKNTPNGWFAYGVEFKRV